MAETLMKHPDEVPALVMMKIAAIRAQLAIPKDENLAFCYKMLNRVSRSFSIVIQQLKPAPLRDAVINFVIIVTDPLENSSEDCASIVATNLLPSGIVVVMQ